jgi:hypothetical protein
LTAIRNFVLLLLLLLSLINGPFDKLNKESNFNADESRTFPLMQLTHVVGTKIKVAVTRQALVRK